jgi:hypothetical protein
MISHEKNACTNTKWQERIRFVNFFFNSRREFLPDIIEYLLEFAN